MQKQITDTNAFAHSEKCFTGDFSKLRNKYIRLLSWKWQIFITNKYFLKAVTTKLNFYFNSRRNPPSPSF